MRDREVTEGLLAQVLSMAEPTPLARQRHRRSIEHDDPAMVGVRRLAEFDGDAARWCRTIPSIQAEAYTTAEREHLVVQGKVHAERLSGDATCEAFFETLEQVCFVRAREIWGVPADPPRPFARDSFVEVALGTSPITVRAALRKLRARYSLAVHLALTVGPDSGLPEFAATLGRSAASHSGLRDEHTRDLVRLTGADRWLDPDRVRLDEALSLVRAFRNDGAITRTAAREFAPYACRREGA
ncbi:MAG: hypothetical protein IT379_30325 [Deltaproteobacteria bacterium]|nr:hypothetical protein [Deltaproteobacteria bacterium]